MNAISPRRKAEARPRDPKGGFRTFGEFLQAVKVSSRNSRAPDPRLAPMNAPGATTTGQERVGEDGGFAVPPEFATEVMEKVGGGESLMARTDVQTTTRNSFSMLIDETTPWQTSAGIQTAWDTELDQLAQSKPNLGTASVRLDRLTALVPVTEELLEDAPALEAHLRSKLPVQMNFAIDSAIIQGTGAGQPQGILNAEALITVAKESGQAADTVVRTNIENMWNRMHAPCRARSVWIINQDVETALSSLSFNGSEAPWPLYIPNNSLANAPHGTLKGRPIVPHEAMPRLGEAGDIILADLSQYLSLRRGDGLKIDTSIHLWFDYVTAAFRAIFRVGGHPWWRSTIERADSNNTNTLSCFVTLAERA